MQVSRNERALVADGEDRLDVKEGKAAEEVGVFEGEDGRFVEGGEGFSWLGEPPSFLDLLRVLRFKVLRIGDEVLCSNGGEEEDE